VRPLCWLAAFSETPCDGPLVRAHLLTRQRLRLELPEGAVWLSGREKALSWRAVQRDGLLERPGAPRVLRRMSLRQLQEDERLWVPACGGSTGLEGHHGEWDGLRLTVPRVKVPPEMLAFVDELGLTAFLKRDARVRNG
jgi:hypothetical protein